MGKIDIYKKKFSILQELSSAVLITDNINAIADILLDAAINYANAEKGSLMLLTDREELSILAQKGLDPQFVGSYKAKIGQGIAGIVAKNRQPVLVADIDGENSFKDLRRDHYKTKSFIACPLVSKNRLLGVLNINDKKDGSPFSEDEFELARTIANQAAIALENASLMTQLKSKAAELEEINKKLVETDILKTEFITRVSHELRTPLNSLKGAIYFLQHTEAVDRKEQDEFHGIISTEINKLVSIVENLLSFLRLEDETRITKKTVLNIGDIFRELQGSKSLMSVLSRKGINLTIDTQDSRLDFVGDKIKVIQLFTNLIDGLGHYLERGDSMEIVAGETSFVTVTFVLSRPLPDYAMSILSDSKYVFQAEHPEDRLKLYLARNIVETHRWKLSAINSGSQCRLTLSIPKSIKQTIDTYVGQSMDSFVEFISELLDIDICSIMLTDELTSELTVKSAIGLDDDIVKRTRIKFGDKIAGWVALEGKPLFIENIEKDDRFSKVSISQYTTKSLLSLPLKIGDRVVGVLNLNNKKTSEPFSQRDYSIAANLSEKISAFIALLYSDNYSEDKLRKLVESFNNLLTVDKTNMPKKDLLPALTGKILKNSRSLRKTKTKYKPDLS
jgi:GAF domain-containing protein